MSIRILKSSPFVTLQDAGRHHFQQYGVSPAGPMDWLSHAIANRLLGNDKGAAALEIGTGGIEIEAATDIRIALASPHGAQTITLHRGEVRTFSPPATCNYIYLAMQGGAGADPVMNSTSMHRRSGLGGTQIMPQSLLHPNAPTAPIGPDKMALNLPKPPSKLRVIIGPQDEMIGKQGMALLLESVWKISARSDRMGIRLEGPALPLPKGADIVSDGIVTGAIQVPGDGLPILLMADRQTTGGYPKPAALIRADICHAAQIPTGGTLQLVPTNLLDAHAALKAQHHFVDGLPQSAQPIGIAGLSSEDLLAQNLIDGAINANG